MIICRSDGCTSIYGKYTICYIFKKTGNIIMSVQFKERKLLSETCEDPESDDESDNNSIMPPLLSKKNGCGILWQ